MFSSERLHTQPKIRPLFCILFKKMIYTCCLILSSAFWEISSVRELIWSFASTIKDTNNIIIKWNHFAKSKFKVQKYLFVAAFPGKSPRVHQKMGANSLPYLPSVISSKFISIYLNYFSFYFRFPRTAWFTYLVAWHNLRPVAAPSFQLRLSPPLSAKPTKFIQASLWEIFVISRAKESHYRNLNIRHNSGLTNTFAYCKNHLQYTAGHYFIVIPLRWDVCSVAPRLDISAVMSWLIHLCKNCRYCKKTRIVHILGHSLMTCTLPAVVSPGRTLHYEDRVLSLCSVASGLEKPLLAG